MNPVIKVIDTPSEFTKFHNMVNKATKIKSLSSAKLEIVELQRKLQDKDLLIRSLKADLDMVKSMVSDIKGKLQ